MSHIHLDRRDFLLSTAAAGASLCLGSLRALARTADAPAIADGDLILGRCADSQTWTDLSPTALSNRLAEGLLFATPTESVGPLTGPSAHILLAAASVQGSAQIRIRLAYPNNKWFEAMRLQQGDQPSGIACILPTPNASIGIEVITTSEDGKTLTRRADLPARRAVYALASGISTSSWRVRARAGALETTAAFCLILAIDAPPARATSAEKGVR